jgi:hypothetical protein
VGLQVEGRRWRKKVVQAQTCCKGVCTEEKYIDFDEIFFPVVKITSIMTILSLMALEYFHLEQLDVKKYFFHGDLEEEIYMQQPQRYEVKEKEILVCRLKKILYGLKQGPRQ